jgi:mono/diheme cytochrome c family protein
MFRRCVAVYLLFACAYAFLGCGPKPDPNETSPQALYEQHCAKCHARAGQPGGPGIGGSRGPDLSKIGRERDAKWLADYIRNPKSVKPEARLMPAFEGVLTDAQIQALADQLAAQK